MNSINVAEVAPGEHRLYLIAGTTGVDSVIAELGHEPNGVFWEGVAELLIVTEAPHLDGRFEFRLGGRRVPCVQPGSRRCG